jgi:protein-arginine kinase activator protein McsA
MQICISACMLRHKSSKQFIANAHNGDMPPIRKLEEALFSDDMNRLQTALAAAIAAEDYVLAARIRDRVKEASQKLRAHVSQDEGFQQQQVLVSFR